MKKLGLIGGLGPESTLIYYQKIVFGVKEKLGEDIFPPLTVESVNMYEVLNLCKEERYDELVSYLLNIISHFKQSGADFAALSANTPHIVFDELKEKSELPLVSIVESACDEAKRRSYKKLGLLGTIFTMKADFFKKPFIANGIDIVTPTDEEMTFVNHKIASEIELGVIKEDTRAAFIKIINRMKQESNIDAVVLGCTELPLILNDNISPVPCLDTMQIHIDTLVDMIAE